ncbi:MAG: hypothetical protein Q9204_007449 [Flavoplaca sp. TL-2023a]
MRLPILTVLLTLVCSISTVSIPRSAGKRNDDDLYCLSYAGCGPDGLKYWNTLHTTLSQANPVENFPNGKPIFDQYYGVAPSESPNPIKRIRQDLIDHGFDLSLLTGWSTMSKNQQTGGLETDPVPAYDNDFDTRNGLLVASANYREWDSQRQLPWSELMFQTWPIVQAAQGGGPISNLKVVIRKEVENQGTQEVLKAMYRNRRGPDGQVLTMNKGDPTWYQWTEEQHAFFFHALIGTDNVKGVVWLLNDHPNAMGKKEIKDIWTRWTERDPDIWINLQPAEWHNYLIPTLPDS